MPHPHLAPATEALALEFGLSTEEYAQILRHLGRTPNFTELGVFSVMWSEHCSYKSSRIHLAKFPTQAAHVIYGPGENAGAIDIGEGLACIFKMESHNHPSFIEPYQGAATGVGGILRDVFTMGARPVALMNALRFGAPEHEKTRRLVSGVVAGIAGYGNCVGVPTVGGETNFHPGYNGNILVNVMCVGLAPKHRIFTSAATGAGNPVVYVGAKTGRDGIHGATMASAEFNEEAESQRPTVQMGDPFLEKLLIEACLELMQHDAIIGIQDMGAAGLTSSSLEMASKGGAGIELIVDDIPAREENMSPYEFMLSESQERMLMTLKPGHEAEAMAIFHKWGLDAVVIGRTTDTGRFVLKWKGEIAADLPIRPLADDAPKYDRPHVKPKPAEPLHSGVLAQPHPAPLTALRRLMACPDMASKRWIWEQYDRHVMADTAADSEGGGDAGIVRIHGSHRALAMTCDVTPRYVAADPFEGGKQAVAESFRNLCVVGATPLAITDNLNFGNPQKPETMGQIVAAIEGMAEACRALDYPVISGNVSLYNETNGEAIPPTPAVGGVGLIADLARKASPGAMAERDVLILVGDSQGHMGASLYVREILGREEGAPPPVNLAAEKRAGGFVRRLIEQGVVRAAHDLSDGGLLCAAAEMALAANIGVTLANPSGLLDAAFLFGEDQARYLLAVPPEREDAVYAAAQAAGVPAEPVGAAGGAEILFGEDALALADLRAAHEGWLPAYMSKAV
ncbi:MAG: phosphoribosylformylglycinamidine synthase subunit PurL [Hyphomonadaceae bacterium]